MRCADPQVLIDLLQGAGIEIACNAQPVLFDSRQCRTRGTIRCPFAAGPCGGRRRCVRPSGGFNIAELDGEIWRGIGLLPDAARALPNTPAQ
jgi:hypothetical protein